MTNTRNLTLKWILLFMNFLIRQI